MEIGTQIKALRTARGVTQEALAEQLGVSPQAVSKWERNATVPDIALLPALSAYFGVTIDELFALSDDTRMERIQNMLWDERVLDRAVAAREEAFLLDKARREPGDGRPYELLADLHNHLAGEHQASAASYAKMALERDADLKNAHSELVRAMGGRLPDWNGSNHYQLIDWYQDFLERHPDNWHGYLFILDQLMDDGRFDEAQGYLDRLAQIDQTFRTPLYRGLLLWYSGQRAQAMEVWEQMCRDFPEEWCVWLQMGDAMARSCQWEKAKEYYRRGLELQKPSRFVDALESIAQICQITGDLSGAIAALEEELALLAQDWDTTTGETADGVRRRIQALEEQAKRQAKIIISKRAADIVQLPVLACISSICVTGALRSGSPAGRAPRWTSPRSCRR